MRRGALVGAVALVAALALAAWGLAATLPHVGDAGPGYLAKAIYPVIMWSLVALSAIGGLIFLVRRR